MWFLECQKAPASENPFEVNELPGSKHSSNVQVRGVILVCINIKNTEYGNISLIQIRNLRTVFSEVDRQSHVFWSQLRDFPAKTCHGITLKIKNLFCNFYWILKMYRKFWALWKKSCASSLRYFRRYWARRMWFLECPKYPVSEHPLKSTR